MSSRAAAGPRISLSGGRSTPPRDPLTSTRSRYRAPAARPGNRCRQRILAADPCNWPEDKDGRAQAQSRRPRAHERLRTARLPPPSPASFARGFRVAAARDSGPRTLDVENTAFRPHQRLQEPPSSVYCATCRRQMARRARFSRTASNPHPAGIASCLFAPPEPLRGVIAKTGLAAERWPSGLRRTPGTRVYGKPYRGFESLSLRHLPLIAASNSLCAADHLKPRRRPLFVGPCRPRGKRTYTADTADDCKAQTNLSFVFRHPRPGLHTSRPRRRAPLTGTGSLDQGSDT